VGLLRQVGIFRQTQDTQTGIIEGFSQRSSVIFGVIVYDEDFRMGFVIVLLEKGLDTALDVGGFVSGGDEDADFGSVFLILCHFPSRALP
jgi:hypothetical protein